MRTLAEALDEAAHDTGFAGVVRVDRGDEMFTAAHGLAHRGYGIANEADTRFAIASGTKGLTALTVVSLIADGALSLSTPAREVLGDDLPLVDDAVTVELLLSHHSGVGDHFDEDVHTDITEYVLPVAVHELLDTEQYLPLLDLPPKFPPGARFSYCNGGYVLLALIAERVSGVPFHQLVLDRVCTPAGMADTSFSRTDEPGPRMALGYLPDGRTNVFHLPIRGTGDGGIYSTAADFSSFWRALFAGRIVARDWVSTMIEPRGEHEGWRYGLGFWLPSSGGVMLEGYDAGVSFRSTHHPDAGVTQTVIANSAEGAWPIARLLQSLF